MRFADKFWEFMIERESIRQRRSQGLPMEQWTNDPIFKMYSFTNVKRIHDRTTTLLWEEFYSEKCKELEHPSREALLNAAIFRYHGTIETARLIGWKTDWDSNIKRDIILGNSLRMGFGESVFTSAYVIPNCGSSAPKYEVVGESG